MRGQGRTVGCWTLAWVLSAGVPFAPVASAAPAKSAKSDDPDTVKAREFIKKAGIHYKVGEYEPAIAAYKEAYKLRPVPALLFNIAQGYRLLGEFKQAKFFYDGCLREDPEAPYAVEAKQRLDEVTAKLAAGPAAPVAPAAPVVATPAPAPPKVTETAEKKPNPELPAAALKPPPHVASTENDAAPDDEGEGPKVLPIALAAGAGVLAIASGVLFGMSQGSWKSVTTAERPRAEVDALLAAGDSQQSAAIGAAVGAVGVGIGAAVTFAF